MEEILRFVGGLFLYFANAIHEVKDIVDSFFFDIYWEGSHLGGSDRTTSRTRDRDKATS
jgi:hypothetical protein